MIRVALQRTDTYKRSYMYANVKLYTHIYFFFPSALLIVEATSTRQNTVRIATMTTSHRPQLEARSGAKAANYVPTSTEHARLLPGHKTVKYRSSNRAKLESKSKNDPRSPKETHSVSNSVDSDEESGDPEAEADGLLDEEEEDSEDEDSEDEKEQFRQELIRLRQRQANITDNKQRTSTRINTDAEGESDTKKAGWRSKTVFGRKKSNSSNKKVTKTENAGYVNNMTKSNYHQNFLDKYVK
ncbi:U2-type spliceosomal complex subunit CWC15 KNAG_0A05010 [Huiozyma naganishii CBS 8797]|uniref:Pre-mRNA-splicing factor CWC15 n=1 Tax=Huiozyma naganishii (strain ATCC MYA-139 / BCRC 22969 / CBS 8797 / KCTC 17520 / NBRC 10181 / NCYC 3082 / Yp74L-3) TaxID=1071383 RepID=J7S2G8_HUIN7|nr:hypothetical protein KNAG_0A05010 [Kazachstania naganishii CBS 8797]CCK68169.1 hypothetical protein KNAG_0A05010 [Kazachstania naganishii CBS 8797]